MPAPPPAIVRCAHLSLKWSADPVAVGKYLADVVAAEHPDLINCTEAKGSATTVRRHLGPTWAVAARGEYLVCYRRAAISPWNGWPSRLRTASGASWSNGPHAGTRRFQVQFTNLRHRASGKRLRVMVLHAPSHVQTGGTWRKLPARVNPYQRGIHMVGRWVAKVRGRGVTQLLTMDSNLEQHLSVWRDYLEEQTGLPSIWHDTRPPEGTEGTRLIDTAHTNARVHNGRVLTVKRPSVFDHRGIGFDIELV